METASAALAFERAALLRDRLQAIDRTLERQEVHAYEGEDYDVASVAVSEPDACVQLFVVRDGTITGREQFFLEGASGAPSGEVLASFLRQHYSLATNVPPEVVVSEEIPEIAAFEAFASERRAARVTLHLAQRGRKRHLAELAGRNAREALEAERVRWLADRGKTRDALEELRVA